MALVRCPKHKIPYNDNNPRGCPACAQEKEGGGEVMQELARASRTMRRSTISGTVISGDLDKPVTTQPRTPKPAIDWRGQFRRFARNRVFAGTGGGLIVVLTVILIATKTARFTAVDNPARFSGVVLPFPVSPNDPLTMVFSALGPQLPQPNPTSPQLARYSYGRDLYVDGNNNLVYAVTIAVPNRSWKGLRIGMNQTNAEGALAMLGTPKEEAPAATLRPDTVAGYVAYRSLEMRPRRTLVAEVRPPNNCFDVQIDLQQRSIGVISRGRQRWYAVSEANGRSELVVTRIRVVSRAMPGPYAGEPAC